MLHSLFIRKNNRTGIQRRFTPLLILLLCLVTTAACGGQAPEASKARSRAVINAGAIVPAEEVRVAEYLNYYEQHFPEPTNDPLALDLRLGNSRMPSQAGPVWLQIGIQARSAESDFVAPLNLALVIDSSGSMADADKMPYVKQSLRLFLESLQPNDIVSIITYSDEAHLLLPAQPLGDGRWVQATIDKLQPDGSTNLHAGMMLGFQEVNRTFDIRRNNRVILLTDGIANAGETNPERIIADALTYNQQGIYLSTIGLGLEFNDALLSELAHQGQGGYSFVDSAQEMDRIFREHVAGLKQRVAGDISLTVSPGPGVRLVSVTDLDGIPPAEGVTIPRPPLGSGDSNVILAQLEVEPAYRARTQPLATVQLTYFDEAAQRPVFSEQTITVERVENLTGYDPTWDLEILRNVTLQQTAQGMREIDSLFQAGQYETAWRQAAALESRLAEVARLTNDPQVVEDVTLMRRYQETLAEALWQTEGRTPALTDLPAAPSQERPYRGSEPAALPTVEIR